MLLKHWLKSLKDQLHGFPRRTRRKAGTHRKQQTQAIPAQTELLEDRTLLAAFIVDSLEDNTTADGMITLREAIAAANANSAVVDAGPGDMDGDTITFDASLIGGTITIDTALGNFEIEDDLVIDGFDGGFNITISGGGTDRIFNINTSSGVGSNMDVVIQNLNLSDGGTTGTLSPGDNGGAILISDGENVTLDFVTITTSTAGGDGGAIFAGDGTLTITNSDIGLDEVTDNDVWEDTLGFTTGSGSRAITANDTVFAFVDDTSASATLEVLDTNGLSLAEPFDPVVAGLELDAAGSVFYDVSSFGGATDYDIYTVVVDETPTTTESELNDTFITADTIAESELVSGSLSTTADVDFFAITTDGLDNTLVVMLDNDPGDTSTITDTIITIFDDDGSTLLATSLFAGEEADAAIITGLDSSTTYFVRISSGGGTTGSYQFVVKSINNPLDATPESEFNNTFATADDLGTPSNNYGTGSITVGSGGNTAVNGGGIYVDGGTLNLTDSSISSNTATGAASIDGGGGIYNMGGTTNVTTTQISFNEATGSAGSGGGILANGGTLNILDSTLEGNSANRAGGGVETRSTVSGVTVNITDGDFFQNSVGSAPGNGGGLHVTSPETGSQPTTVTITGGNFTENFAANEGGGVWNDFNSTMIIKGVQINDNTANGQAGNAENGGGGIFNDGGTVNIQRNITVATVIDGNVAAGTNATSGGGILNDGGTLTITGAVISNNSTNRAGGGIETTTASGRTSNITITNTDITGNTAGGLLETGAGCISPTRQAMKPARLPSPAGTSPITVPRAKAVGCGMPWAEP